MSKYDEAVKALESLDRLKFFLNSVLNGRLVSEDGSLLKIPRWDEFAADYISALNSREVAEAVSRRMEYAHRVRIKNIVREARDEFNRVADILKDDAV